MVFSKKHCNKFLHLELRPFTFGYLTAVARQFADCFQQIIVSYKFKNYTLLTYATFIILRILLIYLNIFC